MPPRAAGRERDARAPRSTAPPAASVIAAAPTFDRGERGLVDGLRVEAVALPMVESASLT